MTNNKQNTNNDVCFVIAPIGEENSEIRKRSDQVLNHIIKPAAESCGFKVERGDEIPESGLITSQIINRVIESPLVIADLTGSNANVFYELAVRHAAQKPLVQIIQKGDSLPFNVEGMRTIPVDHKDLDGASEACKLIGEYIQSVKNTHPDQIQTPISTSRELQLLRQSDNPEQRSIADLLDSVAEVRTRLAGMEVMLSSPQNLIPPSYIRRISEHMAPLRNRRNIRMIEETIFEITQFLFEVRESLPLELSERAKRIELLIRRISRELM